MRRFNFIIAVVVLLFVVIPLWAADLVRNGQTSNVTRLILVNSSTGAPLTGIGTASSGLIISTIASNESAATLYTVAGGSLETITTLGTYASPSSGKIRFKEVDATNHPGLYEIQAADARFAVSNAKELVFSVTGASSLLATHYLYQLTSFDPYDAVRAGLTSLPNANAGTQSGLLTIGANTGTMSLSGNATFTGAVSIGSFSAGSFVVTNGLTYGTLSGGTMTIGTLNITNGIGAASLAITNGMTVGTFSSGTFTFGTLALTNASNLSLLSVGTATNVTNRVTTGGGTIDNVGSVITATTLAGSQPALTISSLNITGAATLGSLAVGTTTFTRGIAITQATTNGNGLTISANGTGTGVAINSGSDPTAIGAAIQSASGIGLYVASGKQALFLEGDGNGASVPAIQVGGNSLFGGTMSISGGLAANVTGNITGNLLGTVSTLTTYTGNTPQTGDSFARIGAAGIGLTSVGLAAAQGSVVFTDISRGGRSLVNTDDLDAVGVDVETINAKIGTPVDSIAGDIATRAPLATALSTANWTNGRAASLDKLDVVLSTRLATAGYTAPPSAATISSTVWAESVRSLTDKANFSLATAPPTASAIKDAVWNELQSGHSTAGTFGKYLDAAISGAGGSGNLTTEQDNRLKNIEKLVKSR